MTDKKKISLNMDDMTFGELETFENVTGLILSDAVRTDIVRDPKTGIPVKDPDDPRGGPLREVKMGIKAMMGLVYVSMLREDPDITWQAIQQMKLSDVELDVVETASDAAGKESDSNETEDTN